MGGNALKNTHTERKTTEEFKLISPKILTAIESNLGYESHIVKYHHNKESHGDMDVLIKTPTNYNRDVVLSFINKSFNPNEIFINSNVISFNYYDFQIDFILIGELVWNMAKHYFDYDCLGNIMGKSYHKFNLSYGWTGLYYKFRNTHSVVDIFITADARKIFEFGGYDYDRYLQGFDCLEEIYEFCIAGKYFNIETFKMENLTQIDRKRNRKRKPYHEFLNYVGASKVTKAFEFNKGKESYLSMIEAYFPEAKLMEKLNALKEEDRLNNIIAQKFNGNIVMMWLPELQGKELGAAMSLFKQSLGDEYREFMLNSSYTAIKERFMKVHNE
jgi:hypothetical protein